MSFERSNMVMESSLVENGCFFKAGLYCAVDALEMVVGQLVITDAYLNVCHLECGYAIGLIHRLT